MNLFISSHLRAWVSERGKKNYLVPFKRAKKWHLNTTSPLPIDWKPSKLDRSDTKGHSSSSNGRYLAYVLDYEGETLGWIFAPDRWPIPFLKTFSIPESIIDFGLYKVTIMILIHRKLWK